MTTTEIALKMVFDRWYAAIERCDKALDSITDDQLLKEIAPGRNRGVYVLGHLVAVHDDMIPVLNLGDKSYPELSEIFIKSPDRTVSEIPSAKELRAMWNKQKAEMKQKFDSLKGEEWFQRHNSVSPEDFVKEPHRNKLNIIVNRTNHLWYHAGQLVLIK